MSTKTAKHWLGPDEQFDSVELDYAVVNRAALEIKQATRRLDNTSIDFDDSEDEPATFADLAELNSNSYNCYGFGGDYGQLVFADVDQADPTHEEKVRKACAEPKLTEESEKTLEVKRKYIDWAMKMWDDVEKDKCNHFAIPEDKRRSRIEKNLDIERVGALPVGSLEYMLGKDKDERNELLMLLSGQTKLTSQRPVYFLVNVIDTAQTTVVGETKGYTTAFDVLENRLIIKPFFSKEGHHPLGDRWLDDHADDSISFIGTPTEFVAQYLDYAKITDAKDAPTEDDGFKIFIWNEVADWITTEFDALSQINEITEEQKDEISKLFENLSTKLEKIIFPKKEKTKPEPKDRLDRGMEVLLDGLETMQFNLRRAAVKAKKDGKEQKAEKAAEVYEKVKESLEEYKKSS